MWQTFDFNESKFRLDWLDPIFIFVVEIELKPWMEFFDSDIQALYSQLLVFMEEFKHIIGTDTYHFIGSGNYYDQCVPREWESEQPERYERVTERLNTLSNSIVETYRDFMKISRIKLSIIISIEE